MVLRLRVDGTRFRDQRNREVILHGINASADAKNPLHPDQPSHEPRGFFDGDKVSFAGRPFEVSEASDHFSRLRKWGYNVIRYVFVWEALEPAGPGKYDEDFIQHTIEVLRVAKTFGFYVFMDPHQDVWSRFTGGSGAPMWTLYACGLDPEKFAVTEAALVQNTWPEPETFPKMIWATSYYRLACQVIFTMFFAGRTFTPICRLDGVNIQDYLQDHFINACKHFAMRIKEAGDLAGDVVIGWESMNEPNRGLIGVQDLTKIPTEQQLKLGTSPTAWEAILTGSGISCEVETWAFGGMGPYKSGTQVVDPKGENAWLSKDYDDGRYGWKRDPAWKLGECVWAQHSVWTPSSQTLLERAYFATDPDTGDAIDYQYFTNKYWLNFYRKYKDGIREVFPDTIIFMQPPTLELPPSIKNTEDDDRNIVYAPHWYDGLTLMTKKWNRIWNVDVIGVLRGRYLTPAFAVKIGERAIRNCFKNQLQAIMKEGLDFAGEHPCLLGETGVPYDMDDSYAYKTGNYSSQTSAMDAVHYAIEGSKINFTLWNYTGTNTHRWGDQWNGEDLSVYSLNDIALPPSSSSATTSFSPDPTSPSYSASHAKGRIGTSISETASSMSAVRPSTEADSFVTEANDGTKPARASRAAEAFVRPYPAAAHGNIDSYGFDLKNCVFELTVTAADGTPEDAPTEVFLPEYHFPKDVVDVEISAGRWTMEEETRAGTEIQLLRWWYAPGQQRLRVKGLVRKQAYSALEGDEGIWARCRENICVSM